MVPCCKHPLEGGGSSSIYLSERKLCLAGLVPPHALEFVDGVAGREASIPELRINNDSDGILENLQTVEYKSMIIKITPLLQCPIRRFIQL